MAVTENTLYSSVIKEMEQREMRNPDCREWQAGDLAVTKGSENRVEAIIYSDVCRRRRINYLADYSVSLNSRSVQNYVLGNQNQNVPIDLTLSNEFLVFNFDVEKPLVLNIQKDSPDHRFIGGIPPLHVRYDRIPRGLVAPGYDRKYDRQITRLYEGKELTDDEVIGVLFDMFFGEKGS